MAGDRRECWWLTRWNWSWYLPVLMAVPLWKDKGLKKSEHISKIIVHPKNSNIVWVASQGPLWSSGGERGLYKSTDGGKHGKIL